MAVSEDTQLGTVLQMNDQSRVAAGNQDKLTLEEYAQLLVNQAQVFDAAHTPKNPAVRRAVISCCCKNSLANAPAATRLAVSRADERPPPR